jgi:hypothetical protein
MHHDEDDGTTLVIRIASTVGLPSDQIAKYEKVVFEFAGIHFLSSGMIERLVLISDGC